MATSIASQLKAIKSALKGGEETIRRPTIRPSIIFDPKEAADKDLRAILPIAISGLEFLIEIDARFGSYKNTLFSQISLEQDREKMVPKEEDKLNTLICSYLRLLSGYMEHSAALNTLEYLIRRYQVHVFNMDELVLCALPYHETHAFVRIIQLLDLGNKKWAFLEGVKASGAPLPRRVIVQQCIRDKGILEALCNYASPTKDFQHARPVICFCTACIVETLGSIQKLDTDTVRRVLGFVFDGLNLTMKGSQDHKAGALMVIGLLATRSILAPKLLQNLLFLIVRMARHDSKESVDLPWLRTTIMAIVTLVQSQSAQMFPKKAVMILNEIRDFVVVLSGLSQEFNLQKFLRLYLEALLDYSTSDDFCRPTLISAIETLPLKDFVEKIVAKLLAYCMNFSSMDNSHIHEGGKWVKQVLLVIGKQYPYELHGAVLKILEKSKMDSREDGSIFHTLCLMLDGSFGMPMEFSVSKLWFSLDHPKAVIRQATLSSIAASGVLKDMAASPMKFMNVQDAIIRRLHDDDLNVVKAALSIDGLAGLINPPCLLKSYCDILSRCIDMINKSTSKSSKASDIAISCLEHLVLEFRSPHLISSKEVATIIFPLLLVLPKTWRVNLKALELAKHVQWSLYSDSFLAYDPICFEQKKGLESAYITSINMKTIGALAETFLKHPQEHIQWLTECSNNSELSKSLFFFIIFQALLIHSEESGGLLKLYRACFHALKLQWEQMESRESVTLTEEINVETFNNSCKVLVEQLSCVDFESLNFKILICIFWCLLKAYTETVNLDTSMQDDINEHLSMLDELFMFFAKSPSKNAFRRHLDFLVRNCIWAPSQFLSKYFAEGYSVEVQIESLRSFATVCSTFALSKRSSIEENCHLQLLLGFPSLLIPLSNENKDIRVTALNCIEGLHQLLKIGNDTVLFHCVSASTLGYFLESILNQRKLISSDVNFFPSYLMSMLSPSAPGLLSSKDIHERFDQQVKFAILDFILNSAVKFSSYGKLMVLSLLKGMGNTMLRVKGVKSLLFELLERHNQHNLGLDIKIFCLLLEVCVPVSNSVHVDADIVDCIIKTLKVDGTASDDPAVVQPCVTVLQNMTCELYDSLKTAIQDQVFVDLVSLFQSDNVDIRNAARETLLRININCSTIIRLFEFILGQDGQVGSSERVKRKKLPTDQNVGLVLDLLSSGKTRLTVLVSLLDILLLKKHIESVSLVEPLFQVLEKLFSNDWICCLHGQGEIGNEDLPDMHESISGAVYYAQQTVLLILKDIIDSRTLQQPKDKFFNKFNLNLLVNCARTAKDIVNRNHVFMLLSSIAKISSGWLSEHIIDVFTVIGESAVKQNDSHSQSILEDLISTLIPCWLSKNDSIGKISTLIPCWLSKNDSIGKLFQIFIKALPEMADYRRVTLIVYLLRTLGEKSSLGILVFHLFCSLTIRTNYSISEYRHQLPSSSIIQREWEYVFAVQLFNQYSCKIWLPCLVHLLQEIKIHIEHEEVLSELGLAMQFILHKLQDTELVFELKYGQDADNLQVTLGELMEQVVLHLQLFSVRSKQFGIAADSVKGFKECTDGVLKTITRWMDPSAYFNGIAKLLEHADGNVKKKTLGLLCESLKEHGSVQKKHKGKRNLKLKSNVFPLRIDERTTPSFNKLCSKIVDLIYSSLHDSVKLPAIFSLEVLAKEFPTDNMIFATCLACVVKHIGSTNLAIAAGCLQATGALITVLGTKALSQLPEVMNHMLDRVHEISNCPIGKSKHRNKVVIDSLSSYGVPLLLSILVTLEAVVESFSGFLNPYLEDILDVILLHREYSLEIDMKLKLKAAAVRRLITQKIPVRLMLMPLVKIYPSALKCGESSLSLSFEMLADIIGAMDRSSIGSYHLKIFKQCLMALDLRRQLPESVKNINMVEQSVIHAMIVLTLKLSESQFRPLFFHSLEWVESEHEGTESIKSRSLDRTISFYKLVNKLIEHHRSLFVPYFKYLLDGCTRYLAEDQDGDIISLTKKRKKAKVAGGQANDKSGLYLKQWHLRALILKGLYQCFLYDTMELKFLDASNFQVLLKPIVHQLALEPPASLEQLSDIPTVEEVDESLILCMGQMAVTARSDVLWKPLNHEVLMHTRIERVRPRILGLKVIKNLVERLKEEYLVFLPETIPFLGELVEDVELPVKALAQEILKGMETLSGESLRQYL